MVKEGRLAKNSKGFAHLRVRVLRLHDLPAADFNVMGLEGGCSDPYVKIYCSGLPEEREAYSGKVIERARYKNEQKEAERRKQRYFKGQT